MNIDNEKLSEYRVLSKLSGKIHVFNIDNKNYGIFDDIIIPYHFMVVILLWKIAGTSLYHTHIDIDLSEIKCLNPNNDYLMSLSDTESRKVISFINTEFYNFIYVNSTEREMSFDDLLNGIEFTCIK